MPNTTNANLKNKDILNPQLAEAIKYWSHIAPVVKSPTNVKEYKKLVSYLDSLLDIVKGDEKHQLLGLVQMISNLISTYEEVHYPAPQVKGLAALKFLMKDHHLKQSDLSEIGSQGVVSEILSGKRSLNARQICLLAKRFNVDPSTFIDMDD